MSNFDAWWDEASATARAIPDDQFNDMVKRGWFGELGNYFFMVFITEPKDSPVRAVARRQYASLSKRQRDALEGV